MPRFYGSVCIKLSMKEYSVEKKNNIIKHKQWVTKIRQNYLLGRTESWKACYQTKPKYV